MPPEVVVVHGIRPVDLEDAPPLDALVGELRDVMRASVPGGVDRVGGGERLADTAARFGVPPDREHHALWDAFVTAELFLVCAARLEAHGLRTLGALRRVGCPPRVRDRLR